jgi:hypothetical protein
MNYNINFNNNIYYIFIIFIAIGLIEIYKKFIIVRR